MAAVKCQCGAMLEMQCGAAMSCPDCGAVLRLLAAAGSLPAALPAARCADRMLVSAVSDTDDDACHCHHVKRDGDLPAHFRLHGLYFKGREQIFGKQTMFRVSLAITNGST